MSINIDALKRPISPALHYLPLEFRIIGLGAHYFEDPYIISRAQAVADSWITWLAWGKTFGYGSYEWKAKVANAVANATIYVGILEKHHGWASEGIIAIFWDGSNWRSFTSAGGNDEMNTITGVTWTNENTFRIEWSQSQVKFYVNGVLKATHDTHIPTEPMQLFAEVGTDATPPASEPTVFFRAWSFRKV